MRARPTLLIVAGLVLSGGVTAAAHESIVRATRTTEATPSAVSRQEHWKGFPCFMGADGRAVTLAPGGIDSRSIRQAMPGGHPLPIDLSGLEDDGSARPALTKSASATPGRFAATDIDTLRVAMIRIDFETDRSGDSTSTADGRFDLRIEPVFPVDPLPHNRDFFAAHRPIPPVPIAWVIRPTTAPGRWCRTT
ncbi:MAG: hypothetical protein FD129_293 [bacterium]|nr:MAG: hypothetical protein FD129_293 [bacterium]